MIITDLYQTKIEASNYNPTPTQSVTVTVSLKDFNGEPVTGKQVTLTCSMGYFTMNGSVSISGTSTKNITNTTDNNGQITGTWTTSSTEDGLCTFSTNTQNLQVNVKKPTVYVYSASVSTGSTKINGGATVTKTATVPTIPSGYSYALAVKQTGWLQVSDASISGTTLTVTLLNVDSGTHSGSAFITIFYYKN